MADEDNVDDGLGEEEGGSAAPAKKGGIGGLLPTLLKYIALALGAIILIVTVVIITMNIMTKQIAKGSESNPSFSPAMVWSDAFKAFVALINPILLSANIDVQISYASLASRNILLYSGTIKNSTFICESFATSSE